MWKNYARLVVGVILLAVAGYFLFGTAGGWKRIVQKEWAATPQQSTPKKSLSKEDEQMLEGAKLHAYGVLAPSEGEDNDGEVPSRTTGAAGPAPDHQSSPPGMDHVRTDPLDGPVRLVHRRFALKYAQALPLVVPPNAMRPRVHGSFSASGGAGAITVMLMNAQEFSDFSHHNESTVSFSEGDSSQGQIDWTLKPTHDDPEKYYLVFRNAGNSGRSTTVDADFTMSFE